jgi:hypothetical protein
VQITLAISRSQHREYGQTFSSPGMQVTEQKANGNLKYAFGCTIQAKLMAGRL